MLDPNDEKTIDKISFNQVFQALQDIILPKFNEVDKKFDEVDKRFDRLEGDIGEMKEQIGELKVMSEVLDRDMTGVKMRLSEVEKIVEAKLA